MLQAFYFHLTAVPARPKAELAAAAREGGSLTRHAQSAAGVNHNTSNVVYFSPLPACRQPLAPFAQFTGWMPMRACVRVCNGQYVGRLAVAAGCG